MSFGFFMFRFTNSEDMDHVPFDGPWALDDAVVVLDHWFPEFRPSSDVLIRITV